MGMTRTTSRDTTTIDVSCDLDCGAKHTALATQGIRGDHAELRGSGWTVLRPLHVRTRTTYVCPACAQRIVLLVRRRAALPAPGVSCANREELDALVSAHNRGLVRAQVNAVVGWCDALPRINGAGAPAHYRIRPTYKGTTESKGRTYGK